MADFAMIKRNYRNNQIAILRGLVGDGKVEGGDYVALNPRRNDTKAGSFRIDIESGKFHDFATGDRGGSIIDLAAFVYGCDLVTAARKLQQFFPFLASTYTAPADGGILAKKKKLDASYIWKKSTKTRHRYLIDKKISIGNARVNIYKGKSRLIVPLTVACPISESELELKGIQFISKNGDKSFPLPFKGLFHIASDYKASKEIIVITEGYATARSIAESTDLYVIAAMSAFNLKSVAITISKQFIYSKIIITADNDEAGRKAAEDVKRAVNSIGIVYPTHECDDFNDLYVAYGADAVRACFKEEIYD